MNVAVVGSRSFNNYFILKKVLDDFHKENKIVKIISGGAKGADSLAERWAFENGIFLSIFRPQYKGPNDRYAPLERNKLIVKSAQIIIAFWDGSSPGTKFTINYAQQLGKKIGTDIFIYQV